MASVQTKRLPGYKAKAVKILRSPAVQATVLDRAQRMQRAAGEGFDTSTYMRRDRATASVITSTFRGRYRQAKYRTLSRAIDAARG